MLATSTSLIANILGCYILATQFRLVVVNVSSAANCLCGAMKTKRVNQENVVLVTGGAGVVWTLP